MDEHRKHRRAFMLKHKGAYEALAQGKPGGCGCQEMHRCSYHEGVEDERGRIEGIIQETFEAHCLGSSAILDEILARIE